VAGGGGQWRGGEGGGSGATRSRRIGAEPPLSPPPPAKEQPASLFYGTQCATVHARPQRRFGDRRLAAGFGVWEEGSGAGRSLVGSVRLLRSCTLNASRGRTDHIGVERHFPGRGALYGGGTVAARPAGQSARRWLRCAGCWGDCGSSERGGPLVCGRAGRDRASGGCWQVAACSHDLAPPRAHRALQVCNGDPR
jgi:hypothetical protein